jgi:hypothetical protein
MIVRHNDFPLTLILARNSHPEELARWCGMSEVQAVGLIDAIDGNPDWNEMWNGICQDLAATGPAPTEQEKREYAAGFAQGQQLLMTACAA